LDSTKGAAEQIAPRISDGMIAQAALRAENRVRDQTLFLWPRCRTAELHLVRQSTLRQSQRIQRTGIFQQKQQSPFLARKNVLVSINGNKLARKAPATTAG